MLQHHPKNFIIKRICERGSEYGADRLCQNITYITTKKFWFQAIPPSVNLVTAWPGVTHGRPQCIRYLRFSVGSVIPAQR